METFSIENISSSFHEGVNEPTCPLETQLVSIRRHPVQSQHGHTQQQEVQSSWWEHGLARPHGSVNVSWLEWRVVVNLSLLLSPALLSAPSPAHPLTASLSRWSRERDRSWLPVHIFKTKAPPSIWNGTQHCWGPNQFWSDDYDNVSILSKWQIDVTCSISLHWPHSLILKIGLLLDNLLSPPLCPILM